MPAPTQLTSAQPAHWPVACGWRPVLDTFFASASGQRLLAFLQTRLDCGAAIFPPQPLRALALTAPEQVHTVILGQDPYHGRGQAEGLAFSVASGTRRPPSLRNILEELARDLGPERAAASPWPLPPAPGGSLLAWAERGTLLLNTCLTVEEGQPASHANRGWEDLADALIAHLAAQPRPRVFMLWGKHAQARSALIPPGSAHLVLSANHPSPLSARRPPQPFIGCGHFGAALNFLQQQAQA